MRTLLLGIVLATTALVLVVFLVPMIMLVRLEARQAAVVEASRRATQLVAVAGSLTAASLSGTPQDGFAATAFLPGRSYGVPAPRTPAVQRAQRCEPSVADGPDGVEVLASGPLPGLPRCAAVIRVLARPEALRGNSWPLTGLAGAVSLLLVAVGLLLAERLGRGLLRSTRDLARAADRMAAGDLSARARPSGPEEIRATAHQLNRLAGRVDALIDAQRQRAADVAHQLRTPLTSLRLDVEALPAQPGRARLVSGLEAVTLALNDVIRASRTPPAEPAAPGTDVVAAVRERIAFWSVLAEDTGRTIHVRDGEVPLRARIERRELDAALDALLGNLFAHTPDGVAGWVRVTLGVDGRVVLVVEDDGPGFPARDVAQRGRSHGASTGLGLDIARRAAERSGGRMVLGASSGGGARIELHLGALPGPAADR